MKVGDWKSIKGFDDYFINKNGQVKSTKRCRGTQERILKPSKNQQGYITYNLMRGGKVFRKPLHRLLMETFIPNKDNLPCINHIDGNILNNSLDNLEWCTYGYNEKEAYRLGLKQSRIKPKQVVQLSKDYKIENVFESVQQIEKTLGYSSGNVVQVCNKKRKSAYGYIWRYADE